MREDGIGRVLVASLHQGIAETLPARLGFYENWLSEAGMREGTIGLAPTLAVLSFLRQEGDAYQLIMTRAGQYAAEWTVEAMTSVRRSLIRSLPVGLRARVLVRVMDGFVRSSCRGSRAVGAVRKGTARFDLRASVFCGVRAPAPHHLCGFYAAACARLLASFDLEGEPRILSCRGAGGTSCILSVSIGTAVAPTIGGPS